MKDYSEKVDTLIQTLHLEPFIHIAPFIPDETMPLVYSAAQMLIYPSLHEGFGLPIIEAFACGTPVATSNTTACPETAGDAAVLFDPEDITAIARAITSVSTDESLRATLRAKGLVRAKEFSWQKVAEENCALYKKLA